MSEPGSPSPPEFSLFRQAALDHRHVQLEGELFLRAPRYLGGYMIGLTLFLVAASAGFLFFPVTIEYRANGILAEPSAADERALLFSSPIATRVWSDDPSEAILVCSGNNYSLIGPDRAVAAFVGQTISSDTLCELKMTATYPNLKGLLW